MTLYFSIYFAKTNIMAISTQTLYKVETFPLSIRFNSDTTDSHQKTRYKSYTSAPCTHNAHHEVA